MHSDAEVGGRMKERELPSGVGRCSNLLIKGVRSSEIIEKRHRGGRTEYERWVHGRSEWNDPVGGGSGGIDGPARQRCGGNGSLASPQEAVGTKLVAVERLE